MAGVGVTGHSQSRRRPAGMSQTKSQTMARAAAKRASAYIGRPLQRRLST